MTKTTYRAKRLNAARRKILNVNRFGGLDLSNQKFNVSAGRAIDSKDFYLKDNVLQVREGFEELYDVAPQEFIALDFKTNAKVENATVIENPVKFNGIWKFVGEDDQLHFVAHIGYLLYEIKNFGTKEIVFELLANDTRTDTADGKTRRLLYKFENQRTFAFVGSKMLWFLGGNHYMVIRFNGDTQHKIQPVEDNEITFVPKTSIGITYTNAQVPNRELLDYPNMLTMFRRNTLLSGVGKNEESLLDTEYFEYVLDGSLLTKSNELSGGVPTDEAQKAFSKIHLIIRERGEI